MVAGVLEVALILTVNVHRDCTGQTLFKGFVFKSSHKHDNNSMREGHAIIVIVIIIISTLQSGDHRFRKSGNLPWASTFQMGTRSHCQQWQEELHYWASRLLYSP